MVNELDEFLDANPRRKTGPPCGMCALFSVNPELAELIREARSRVLPVPFSALTAFLRSKGHTVGAYQLRDHFLKHERSR